TWETRLAADRVDELFRRLRWPVLRRLAVHPGGDERSAVRGQGIEYNEVRGYQPGDDPRLIDWNLTARSSATYVRMSYPDRGLDVWLVVDTSRSLDWGTARCLKRQTALDLVVAASQLLARHGNRVGALLCDWRVHQVDPSSRRLRERFREAAEQQQAWIRREILGSGAGLAELTTEEELLPQLVRFFQQRRALMVAGSRSLAGPGGMPA